MTDWATALIPVGSLLAGSALTMWGQALTDRRVLSRERAARQEQFTVTRYELDRATLTELQQIVLDLHEAVVATTRPWKDGHYEAATMRLLNQATRLTARCLSDGVRSAMDDYQAAAYKFFDQPTGRERRLALQTRYYQAQEAMGEALRHSPFERPDG
ncbi:hypothetical protein [Spirillospora sp. CA-128828]|uniref:hypothetical protein n=1 Tax=Spirillospora sp. CA-128828 TaxID=3240033 RepID=UPI003D8C514C